MEGWISLHRKIKDHWIWQSENRLKWWLDLLLTVNHEDKKVLIGGTLIDCNRGQSVRSLSHWAKDWNVTKKTVRDFFILLQNDGMIEFENIKISTRITICKYDSYQILVNDKETANKRQVNGKETASKRELPTNNNDNNDNNDNKKENIFNFKKSLIALGVEETIVNDWLKVRKTKKASNTETAFNAIKNQISISGLTANECIKIACERSWQGFKAEWIKDKKPKPIEDLKPQYKRI